MLKKIFLLAFLALCVFAIQKREQDHQLSSGVDHELFGFSEPDNPKNRTEKEVCEHYGGKMCTVFKVGLKCCKDGWIFKDSHCGGVGCEHDTLSITDMSWDY